MATTTTITPNAILTLNGVSTKVHVSADGVFDTNGHRRTERTFYERRIY